MPRRVLLLLCVGRAHVCWCVGCCRAGAEAVEVDEEAWAKEAEE